MHRFPKTQMFQGTLSLSHRQDLYSLLNKVADYKHTTQSNNKLINKLNVLHLKISSKGNFGNIILQWDFNSTLEISDENYQNIGAIHLQCKTEPGDLNISLLYFVSSKKLKVSGKLLDIEIAAGLGQEENSKLSLQECIHNGLRYYMNDIQQCCVIMFQSDTPLNCHDFVPSLMNGMFEVHKKILHVQNMSNYAHNYSHITYSEGQEPELNGRIFSIKLELDIGTKLILDHTGKVQIFSAKSYNIMVQSMNMFYEYLDYCVKENIVNLQDICEYSHWYIVNNSKEIKQLKPNACFFS
jgi:hypothetical protein